MNLIPLICHFSLSTALRLSLCSPSSLCCVYPLLASTVSGSFQLISPIPYVFFHSLYYMYSVMLHFFVHPSSSSSCLSFFSWAQARLTSVSEWRKAEEQRWRSRLQLCCGAMKRGPRPGSLEQYKSTNHPGQLTPSASHIYTLDSTVTHSHTHTKI